MLPKSLQWRLVSFFCLIIVCLMIPVWLFLNNRIEGKYYDDFVKRIEKGFNNWALRNDEPDATELNDELVRSSSLFLLDLENRSYTITDKYGEFLFTNDEEFLQMQDPVSVLNALLSSGNFVQAMAGGDRNRKSLVNYNGVKYFDYAKPIGQYILYFKYKKDDWAGLINDFSRIILTSVVLGLAISFTAGYFLSRTITAPLKRLMYKANGIASGDFEQILEVKSDDEIGKLTDTFNYMASSLKTTLAEISSEKSKMETIFNYMTDGIIAFNLKGGVIHTNPAAMRLLGMREPFDSFQKYCDRYGFKYCLEDVLYLQAKGTEEMNISINGRTVKVYFATFTDEAKKPEGVIVVLQDITEQQRLENMRKEFVANVSHELRTPLTSVKSYSETLLDGALEETETARRFLRIINAEADRMTRLIKDLLQLSRLDNQQMIWNFERMSLERLVRGAVERMQLEATLREQKLECFVLGDMPELEADVRRLEQVIFNILSNALKYTAVGGAITVYMGRIYNDVYFKVADSGIGIPDADLPRIFERFYRADKARSRELGGTGLGLAIAKEIVEAHGGVITVNSQEGKGSEVTVRLPLTRK